MAPLKKPSEKHILKPPAFTLLELIVVITILAILGTIGFLSIGGYSSNARDSQRLSDVNSLAKSLDVYVITSGSYPVPDNYFTLTYSGWAIWYQWTFGSGALSKFGGNGINKRPVDPLKFTEYVYSSLAYGKAYSIKTDYEGSLTARNNSLVPTAYAASGNPTISLIKGNYNGSVAKTQTGTMVYVLAIPSIVTNTGSAGQAIDVSWTALSGTLLFNGKGLTGASSFNPNVVIFSGTTLPKDDTSSDITNMMTILKSAYANSDIANLSALQSISNAATWSLATLGAQLITANLGWNASATSAASSVLAYSSGATYVAGQQFTYNGATITVSATGIGTSNTKADSACDTNDITLWQWGTNNVQVWAACNVGATTTSGYNTVPVQSPNPTATPDALPPDRVLSVQGNYYQWGRNDNVTSGTWTTSQWGGAFVSPANTTGNTNFYQGESTYTDWKWAGASNPAGGWNIANGGDNQWPCPSGYHIPTGGTSDNTTEWGKLYTIINSATTFGSCSQANVYDRTVCAVKLPYAGTRNWSNGQYYVQGTDGRYWSSSPNTTNARNAYFVSGGGNIAGNSGRGFGFSLRCVKN